MNLKKAGSIICATGVMLSLAVPTSAAAAPISVETTARESMVVARGMYQSLFNSGRILLDGRERTVGSATSRDSASQLGVYFEGVHGYGRVEVNLYVNSSRYSKVLNLQAGATSSSTNMVDFQNLNIKNGSNVEVTVRVLDQSAFDYVDNIEAICF